MQAQDLLEWYWLRAGLSWGYYGIMVINDNEDDRDEDDDDGNCRWKTCLSGTG